MKPDGPLRADDRAGPPPDDRRRKLVRVAEEGAELVHRLAPAVVEVSEHMLAPFTPEERDRFLDLLRRAAGEPEAG